MKQEFLDFLNRLMEANSKLTEELMTDNVKIYIDTLKEEKVEKPELTDNGKLVLKFLQDNQDVKTWKSRDIAEQIGISSRTVSGCSRKLVNDGFVEKIAKDPVIYTLTEKGKNYNIIEGENENA